MLKNDYDNNINNYLSKMFIISGDLYDDEEIMGEFPDCEEEEKDDTEIDTYTMFSFIVQERYSSTTVCY